MFDGNSLKTFPTIPNPLTKILAKLESIILKETVHAHVIPTSPTLSLFLYIPNSYTEILTTKTEMNRVAERISFLQATLWENVYI